MFNWTVHLKGGPNRARHSSVAVGHKVYSFGWDGNMYNVQIDVYVFNTVSLRWLKLSPVTTGREGPPEDFMHFMGWRNTAVLIGDIIYMWGGVTYKSEYSNVLYAFDVETHSWFKPRTSGTVPEARCYHSACALGKIMYIYGGYAQRTGCMNNFYKLDTTTMVWALINTRGTPAPASECHTATIIGTNIFVFGGYTNCNRGRVKDHNNHVRVFDTETNYWLSTPSAQLRPQGRVGNSDFAYNRELYIFGGHNWDQNFNDLWKYDPETFSWEEVKPKGKGPCSQMYRMCCCMVGDCVILLGGGSDKPDDLYILDLCPNLKTLCKLAVIQYGLEPSGLPHDIRWELAAMTANRNTISYHP